MVLFSQQQQQPLVRVNERFKLKNQHMLYLIWNQSLDLRVVVITCAG